jgi:hypothetical protein
MWWYPSGRFPNTCRERFNFAGARKETAEALKGTPFQTLFLKQIIPIGSSCQGQEKEGESGEERYKYG